MDLNMPETRHRPGGTDGRQVKHSSPPDGEAFKLPHGGDEAQEVPDSKT